MPYHDGHNDTAEHPTREDGKIERGNTPNQIKVEDFIVVRVEVEASTCNQTFVG